MLIKYEIIPRYNKKRPTVGDKVIIKYYKDNNAIWQIAKVRYVINAFFFDEFENKITDGYILSKVQHFGGDTDYCYYRDSINIDRIFHIDEIYFKEDALEEIEHNYKNIIKIITEI